MPETPDSQGVMRHRATDPEAFHAAVRHQTNAVVETHGHHPHHEYTPAAWRHYTRRRALLDRIKGLQFESVLDVGCSEGYFMSAIAEARGAEVWGIDLSDRSVAVAAARYGLPVAAAKATALPFADGAFDLVLSTETIEHVLDPEAMIAEMRRVSRRHVVVTTPVSQTEHEHEPDYELDLRVAKRFGRPHRRFVPLRNRDWIIVTSGAGLEPGPREWRCPQCHGPLVETPDGLRCHTDDVTFPFAGPGLPDFARGER